MFIPHFHLHAISYKKSSSNTLQNSQFFISAMLRYDKSYAKYRYIAQNTLQLHYFKDHNFYFYLISILRLQLLLYGTLSSFAVSSHIIT